MLKLLGLGNYVTQFYLHVLNRMAEGILAHETPSGQLTDTAMVQMNLARKWMNTAEQER